MIFSVALPGTALAKGDGTCIRHFYNNSFYSFQIGGLVIGGPGRSVAMNVPPHSAVELRFNLPATMDEYWFVNVTSDIPIPGARDAGERNRWSVKKQAAGLKDCPYINHGSGGDANRPLEDALYFNDPADGDISTCEGICSPTVNVGDADRVLRPVCTPKAADPVSASIVYGIGRDGLLYRKSSGPNSVWQSVPGYTSTKRIRSIAARPDESLLGLDDSGHILQLARPYSAEWADTGIPANARLRSIVMLADGRIVGMTDQGIEAAPVAGQVNWTAYAIRTSPLWPFTTFAVMPNGHVLLGVRESDKPGQGGFSEYRIADGKLIRVIDPIKPYYPPKLTGQLYNERPDSFTYLPNGQLVLATQVDRDQLITWYVNNCGEPTQSVLSNAGAPPLTSRDMNPRTAQWRTLAVVVPQLQM